MEAAEAVEAVAVAVATEVERRWASTAGSGSASARSSLLKDRRPNPRGWWVAGQRPSLVDPQERSPSVWQERPGEPECVSCPVHSPRCQHRPWGSLLVWPLARPRPTPAPGPLRRSATWPVPLRPGWGRAPARGLLAQPIGVRAKSGSGVRPGQPGPPRRWVLQRQRPATRPAVCGVPRTWRPRRPTRQRAPRFPPSSRQPPGTPRHQAAGWPELPPALRMRPTQAAGRTPPPVGRRDRS